MRERELKRAHLWACGVGDYVAPHAGARIETGGGDCSKPPQCVAPHAGARIETPLTHPSISASDVAPHAGARIETQRARGIRGGD